MPYKGATPREILRSADFVKQFLAYTLLCIGRFFFPHPEIENSSFEFYGMVVAYFLLTMVLVFSYEALHDAFSTKGDEFSRATPREKWLLRLLLSAYLAFLLVTPKGAKLPPLVAWVFGTAFAYTVAGVRLRRF